MIETFSAAASFVICQDYAAYIREQHAVWAELVRRVLPELEEHAAQEYLDGLQFIDLKEDCPLNLESISARLSPRIGWNSTPVSAFLPAPAFFEMTSMRCFPMTTWLRSRESLEYTPEPDIFHDVFGHVPMHALPVLADFLQHYRRVRAATSDAAVLDNFSRLFWYTVEFEVIRQRDEIKVYGSGIIVPTANVGMLSRTNAPLGSFPSMRCWTLPQKSMSGIDSSCCEQF
jgi:phenylalanine-4-hydroxylase